MLENIYLILVTLLVFQFDNALMSESKVALPNMLSMFVTLLVLQFDKAVVDVILVFENMLLMFVTLLVSQFAIGVKSDMEVL